MNISENSNSTTSNSNDIYVNSNNIEIVGTSDIASNSKQLKQEITNTTTITTPITILTPGEEMSENKRYNMDNNNNNSTDSNCSSNSSGQHAGASSNIIIEENERLEHENQEIQEIYRQKGMEFQKKDLRYGYESGETTSVPPRSRNREGSILNLKKQGIVKEISQKFQTPDTASYTKPVNTNISIKDKILLLKKEQEKRKQDQEAQQREKVIVLSSDTSNIQIYHPSVIIDKMNSKLDTETPIPSPPTPPPTPTEIVIEKVKISQQSIITTPTTTITTKPIQEEIKTPIITTPTPTPSTQVTSPTNSKNNKKNNKNKDKKSKAVVATTITSPTTVPINNIDTIKDSDNRKRRGGRALVTPSSDLKKNIQIYFTIPSNPIPVKSNKPNQLQLQPSAQQFLKSLIAESDQNCKLNESLINSISDINNQDDSIADPATSLLNVKSLRVKAIKTSFEILFLMPNQSKKILLCKGTDSIEILKERVITEYLSNVVNNNNNKSVGAESYLILDFNGNPLERSLILNKCDYILDKRAQGLIPKLKVIEKSTIFESIDPSAELTIQEYETILKLIPSTNLWRGEEVDHFRRVTGRLRYEALPIIKGSIQSTLLVRLSPLPIPIIGSKILISVFLPITQVTKTMDLELNETADQFTNRLFLRNYSKHLPNVTASDFILKVVGSSDYIHGAYDIRTFESIRNHIIQGTKPQLTLIQRPKSELDPPPFKPRFDFPPELPNDTSNGDGDSNGSWDKITHISIRDIKKSFRVKVLGSTRIPISCVKDDDNCSVIVSISLYHGIECFSKAFTQPVIPPPFSFLADSLSIDWCEWLIFNNIDYSNLPIDARLSISVYSAPADSSSIAALEDYQFINDDSGANDGNLVPIGWINVMISDFRYQLRQGIIELSLWPGEFSNPLGTCSNNPSSNQSIGLTLEFEEFNLPVIFPRKNKLTSTSLAIEQPPTNINSNEMREFFETITSLDPLSDLKIEKYNQLWALRHYSILFPMVLPRLMLSVPWTNASAVDEAILLLDRWPKLKPYEALELLDAKHANRKVREFAVTCLEDLSEDELLDILLQLVQVLKYEPFHDSKLSRFLLRKAILNRNIGHSFFWYLKSDLHVSNLSERFGILLESYLYACGAHRIELLKQMEVINNLTEVAKKIKPLKDQDRREFMIKEFESLEWPKRFHLTLNPRFESNGLIINKCKYMDSKKLPLRLSFTNTDMNAEPIEVIFKAGDDLRQDMLTLQMIRLMDKLWQKEGLDLKLSPYGCISTGDMIGMIEVVLNSETTAKIQKSAGGGAAAAFKLDPLANWLLQHNKSEAEYQKAVDTFILSCAGYCVATYVLGIGDRHNDNLMCTRGGRLFHIDFGHFLGNYKKKFGFKRERAPFVFTPDFCYVMGGKESFKFSQFVNYCCTAYNIVRKNAKLFMNLFAMMVSTGIPELQSMEDLAYLKESFSLELSDEKARDKFVALIHESLATKTTQINNMIHILAH